MLTIIGKEGNKIHKLNARYLLKSRQSMVYLKNQEWYDKTISERIWWVILIVQSS